MQNSNDAQISNILNNKKAGKKKDYHSVGEKIKVDISPKTECMSGYQSEY